jgi:hypothetical protein
MDVFLRNVLLQQKILPALCFERNIVTATLEKEWHRGLAWPTGASKTKPKVAALPAACCTTAMLSLAE